MVLEFNGFSSETAFFGDALDKYGIQVQVVRAGRYKSAVEPFVQNQRSPQSRQQLQQLLNRLWTEVVTAVADSREVSAGQLQAIADRHHIPIIEDCAQATGATWGDRKVGSLGQIGCFSFYPTKNLGACGDGGMVITDDSALADEMRMLREHGSRQRYIHEAIGVNSRLDAIQATILQVKLRHLDAWNVGRTEAADRYAQCLSHNLRSLSPVQLPRAIAGGQATWNQYTLRIGDGKTPELRDRVRAGLQAAGIGTAVYYPLPLHLQPVYAHLGYQPGQLPIAERTAHQVLSLPMFPELSPTQQEAIATALAHSLTQAAAPVGEGVR